MSDDLVKRLTEQHSITTGDIDSIIAYVEYSNSVRHEAAARITVLEAENKRLREALLDVLSHLVAAESLLFRGGKSAAPSDKMFDIMLQDYRNSIERGRAVAAALEKK